MQSQREIKCEIDNDGNKRWKNSEGKLHREDGPAIEHSDGSRSWYINGKFHREDGPAVERADGSLEWWSNGKLHREDGPAIEYVNGSREWYINGKLHREDGPAVEYCDGSREWYINGKLHREDGPAVEYADGLRYWYLNGQELTEEQWREKFDSVKGKLIPYKTSFETIRKKNSTIPIVKKFQDRTKESLYRVAGRKLSRTTKSMLLKLLKKRGATTGVLESASKFFESDIGEIFVSYVLGMILETGTNNIPKIDSNILKGVFREMQIDAASNSFDILTDEFIKMFIPIIQESMREGPDERVRVDVKDEHSESFEDTIGTIRDMHVQDCEIKRGIRQEISK
jgi:hypothetical protein